MWLRIGRGAGEFANEPSGSMEYWEFVEKLRHMITSQEVICIMDVIIIIIIYCN